MCMCILPSRLCMCASIDCVRTTSIEAFDRLCLCVLHCMFLGFIARRYSYSYPYSYVFTLYIQFLFLCCSLAFSYFVSCSVELNQHHLFIFVFFFSLSFRIWTRKKCCCSVHCLPEPHSLVLMLTLMFMFMFWLQFTHTHAILRNSALLERFYVSAALTHTLDFDEILHATQSQLCTTYTIHKASVSNLTQASSAQLSSVRQWSSESIQRCTKKIKATQTK